MTSLLRRQPRLPFLEPVEYDAKLSQNPMVLIRFRIAFERKQMPRIEENLRKTLNETERMESDRIRPRQVRYQTALRPDSEDLRFYCGFPPLARSRISILWRKLSQNCPGASADAITARL